jgi:hypothetical protein
MTCILHAIHWNTPRKETSGKNPISGQYLVNIYLYEINSLIIKFKLSIEKWRKG